MPPEPTAPSSSHSALVSIQSAHSPNLSRMSQPQCQPNISGPSVFHHPCQSKSLVHGQQSSAHGQSKSLMHSQQSPLTSQSKSSVPSLQPSVAGQSKSSIPHLKSSVIGPSKSPLHSQQSSVSDQSKSPVHIMSVTGQQPSVPGQLGTSVHQPVPTQSSVPPHSGTALPRRKSLKLLRKSGARIQLIEEQLFERLLYCAKNDTTPATDAGTQRIIQCSHNHKVSPKKQPTSAHNHTYEGKLPTLQGKVQYSVL